MHNRTRYAIVGVGGRSYLFSEAILGEYKDRASLVGLCDLNPGRVTACRDRARSKHETEVPGFAHGDFAAMIEATKPDTVIVTSVDATHDEYICQALAMGCDVITEKPMTTDEVKCQRILDAQRASGRQVRVCFNYRYAPFRTQVKDLLMSGVIGDVLSVDFDWMLDTRHGADYFRRWHRWKKNSGGLLVHKATHHFDLVNWWLSSEPRTVFASGDRSFYTPKTAERLGLHRRGERCRGCPELDNCDFSLRVEDYWYLKRLYLDNEQHDGYFRDRCVFSSDMDIEDRVSVTVSYENDVRMSYSLNAFCPWEGYVISFNGTRGRLEHKCEESVYISGDGSVPGALVKEGSWIRVFPQRAPAHEVDLWTSEGGHGGADPAMLADILDPERPADRYGRAADQRAGAWSIITGIAANRSIAENRLVHVNELLPDAERPPWPTSPTSTDSSAG